MTYPALIFIGLLLWSFRWPKEKLLYLMAGSAAFGSLAIVPPELVGGINLLPGFAAGLVLIARYALDPRDAGRLIATAFNPRGLGVLTMFTIFGVLTAYALPRMFMEQVQVLPMRAAVLAPLEPTKANITQSGYLVLSLLLTLVFAYAGSRPSFIRAYLKAMLLGGAVLILTGLIDLAVGGTSARALIAPFKTAQYTYMDMSQVLGLRRVVGFMTESSSYGSVCVSMASGLLFLAPSYPTRKDGNRAQLIALGLLAMAVLSTSSTAYVGLAVLSIFYAANLIRRLYARSARHKGLLKWEMLALVAAIMGLAVALLVNPSILATPWAFVDTLIFQKAKSESYLDRMTWNRVAMQALAESHWIGVGVGSTRASNWVIAVLSNTGLIGGVLMFGFILFMLLKRPGPTSISREILIASKLYLLVTLAMATLAGTTPDFGGMSTMFGLIIANSQGAFGRRRTRLTGPSADYPSFKVPHPALGKAVIDPGSS